MTRWFQTSGEKENTRYIQGPPSRLLKLVFLFDFSGGFISEKNSVGADAGTFFPTVILKR